MNFPIYRTPEEGHSKRCLADAMINVITMWRNDEQIGDVDFTTFAQSYGMDYGVLAEARELLNAGLNVCICDPISLK